MPAAPPVPVLPSLRGTNLPEAAQTAIRQLGDRLLALEGRPAVAPARLDYESLIGAIHDDLSPTGSHPLDVSFLLGADGGGSGTTALVGTHAERNSTPAGSYDAGTLFFETDRAAFYRVRAQGANSFWTYMLQGSPFRVTLSPDAKPTGLTTEDENFLIHATDYDRIYRWNGAAWVDAPGQQPRRMIQYFDTATAAQGWALCNGGVTNISTPAGGREAYTTPDLIAAGRILVAAAAPGNPSGSASNSLSLQGGSTYTVRVDPPIYHGVPQIRL